jgi:hypothetical protein
MLATAEVGSRVVSASDQGCVQGGAGRSIVQCLDATYAISILTSPSSHAPFCTLSPQAE